MIKMLKYYLLQENRIKSFRCYNLLQSVCVCGCIYSLQTQFFTLIVCWAGVYHNNNDNNNNNNNNNTNNNIY